MPSLSDSGNLLYTLVSLAMLHMSRNTLLYHSFATLKSSVYFTLSLRSSARSPFATLKDPLYHSFATLKSSVCFDLSLRSRSRIRTFATLKYSFLSLFRYAQELCILHPFATLKGSYIPSCYAGRSLSLP